MSELLLDDVDLTAEEYYAVKELGGILATENPPANDVSEMMKVGLLLCEDRDTKRDAMSGRKKIRDAIAKATADNAPA